MSKFFQLDIESVLIGILLSGGGYLIIAGCNRMAKEDLNKKCGRFGYMLHKLTISWRAAYWNCFFTVIKYPLVFIAVAIGLGEYRSGYGLEAGIVMSIISIPPAIAPIMPFLRTKENDAERSLKEDL